MFLNKFFSYHAQQFLDYADQLARMEKLLKPFAALEQSSEADEKIDDDEKDNGKPNFPLWLERTAPIFKEAQSAEECGNFLIFYLYYIVSEPEDRSALAAGKLPAKLRAALNFFGECAITLELIAPNIFDAASDEDVDPAIFYSARVEARQQALFADQLPKHAVKNSLLQRLQIPMQTESVYVDQVGNVFKYPKGKGTSCNTPILLPGTEITETIRAFPINIHVSEHNFNYVINYSFLYRCLTLLHYLNKKENVKNFEYFFQMESSCFTPENLNTVIHLPKVMLFGEEVALINHYFEYHPKSLVSTMPSGSWLDKIIIYFKLGNISFLPSLAIMLQGNCSSELSRAINEFIIILEKSPKSFSPRVLYFFNSPKFLRKLIEKNTDSKKLVPQNEIDILELFVFLDRPPELAARLYPNRKRVTSKLQDAVALLMQNCARPEAGPYFVEDIARLCGTEIPNAHYYFLLGLFLIKNYPEQFTIEFQINYLSFGCTKLQIGFLEKIDEAIRSLHRGLTKNSNAVLLSYDLPLATLAVQLFLQNGLSVNCSQILAQFPQLYYFFPAQVVMQTYLDFSSTQRSALMVQIPADYLQEMISAFLTFNNNPKQVQQIFDLIQEKLEKLSGDFVFALIQQHEYFFIRLSSDLDEKIPAIREAKIAAPAHHLYAQQCYEHYCSQHGGLTPWLLSLTDPNALLIALDQLGIAIDIAEVSLSTKLANLAFVQAKMTTRISDAYEVKFPIYRAPQPRVLPLEMQHAIGEQKFDEKNVRESGRALFKAWQDQYCYPDEKALTTPRWYVPAARMLAFQQLHLAIETADPVTWREFHQTAETNREAVGRLPDEKASGLGRVKELFTTRCTLRPQVEHFTLTLNEQAQFFEQFKDPEFLAAVIRDDVCFNKLSEYCFLRIFQICDKELFMYLINEHRLNAWQALPIPASHLQLDRETIAAMFPTRFAELDHANQLRRQWGIPIIKPLHFVAPGVTENSAVLPKELLYQYEDSDLSCMEHFLLTRYSVLINVLAADVQASDEKVADTINFSTMSKILISSVSHLTGLLSSPMTSLASVKKSPDSQDHKAAATKLTIIIKPASPWSTHFFLIPTSSYHPRIILREGEPEVKQAAVSENSKKIKQEKFDNSLPTKFLKNLHDLVMSHHAELGDPPLVFLGVLCINGNHYIPYFIHKNDHNEINIITVDPSPAPNRAYQPGLALQQVLKGTFVDAASVRVMDVNIAQQLRQRDCATNSMTVIEDALRTVNSAKPLIRVVNGTLLFDPTVMTNNGNLFRCIDYDHPEHRYLYDAPKVTRQSEANRARWAARLSEYAEPYRYVHAKQNVAAPFTRFVTQEKYNYQKQVETQSRADEAGLISDQIYSIMQMLGDTGDLEQIKHEFVRNLSKPDDQIIRRIVGSVEAYLKDFQDGKLSERLLAQIRAEARMKIDPLFQSARSKNPRAHTINLITDELFDIMIVSMANILACRKSYSLADTKDDIAAFLRRYAKTPPIGNGPEVQRIYSATLTAYITKRKDEFEKSALISLLKTMEQRGDNLFEIVSNIILGNIRACFVEALQNEFARFFANYQLTSDEQTPGFIMGEFTRSERIYPYFRLLNEKERVLLHSTCLRKAQPAYTIKINAHHQKNIADHFGIHLPELLRLCPGFAANQQLIIDFVTKQACDDPAVVRSVRYLRMIYAPEKKVAPTAIPLPVPRKNANENLLTESMAALIAEHTRTQAAAVLPSLLGCIETMDSLAELLVLSKAERVYLSLENIESANAEQSLLAQRIDAELRAALRRHLQVVVQQRLQQYFNSAAYTDFLVSDTDENLFLALRNVKARAELLKSLLNKLAGVEAAEWLSDDNLYEAFSGYFVTRLKEKIDAHFSRFIEVINNHSHLVDFKPEEVPSEDYDALSFRDYQTKAVLLFKKLTEQLKANPQVPENERSVFPENVDYEKFCIEFMRVYGEKILAPLQKKHAAIEECLQLINRYSNFTDVLIVRLQNFMPDSAKHYASLIANCQSLRDEYRQQMAACNSCYQRTSANSTDELTRVKENIHKTRAKTLKLLLAVYQDGFAEVTQLTPQLRPWLARLLNIPGVNDADIFYYVDHADRIDRAIRSKAQKTSAEVFELNDTAAVCFPECVAIESKSLPSIKSLDQLVSRYETRQPGLEQKLAAHVPNANPQASAHADKKKRDPAARFAEIQQKNADNIARLLNGVPADEKKPGEDLKRSIEKNTMASFGLASIADLPVHRGFFRRWMPGPFFEYSAGMEQLRAVIANIKRRHGNKDDFTLDYFDACALTELLAKRWEKLKVDKKFDVYTDLTTNKSTDRIYLLLSQAVKQIFNSYACKQQDISAFELRMPGVINAGTLTTEKLPENIASLVGIFPGNKVCIDDYPLKDIIIFKQSKTWINAIRLVEDYRKHRKLMCSATGRELAPQDVQEIVDAGGVLAQELLISVTSFYTTRSFDETVKNMLMPFIKNTVYAYENGANRGDQEARINEAVIKLGKLLSTLPHEQYLNIINTVVPDSAETLGSVLALKSQQLGNSECSNQIRMLVAKVVWQNYPEVRFNEFGVSGFGTEYLKNRESEFMKIPRVSKAKHLSNMSSAPANEVPLLNKLGLVQPSVNRVFAAH